MMEIHARDDPPDKRTASGDGISDGRNSEPERTVFASAIRESER